MSVRKKLEGAEVVKKLPAFSKDMLIQGAKEFNITPELMAGALYDVEGPLTRQEAEDKVKAFLAKKVEGGI